MSKSSELQAELDKINAMREELNRRAKEVAAALESVQAVDAAKAKIAAMTDAERAALNVALAAEKNGA